MTTVNYVERLNAINRDTPAPIQRVEINETPIGRSVPAILLACFVSFFLLPLGVLFAALTQMVFDPGYFSEGDEQLGVWFMFGFGNGALIVGLAGVIWNRARNYATNIMFASYVIGYALGYAFVNAAYKLSGLQSLY
ncbi:hypothetical protein SAMN04488515_1013 [Cognatiyoonia koreensis]|uniref:Uncharacterized protein n=1 Tax=Cognatiyoonia koreensis TaxID=364200 RepID=A0A1I0P5J9_9RHOB|nr:hypothetical protein [Cognatiyoonia koreensis]SEW09354.1 hypothetical protein SAMN04488515_1013 [Cognatiyoonia koreensis]